MNTNDLLLWLNTSAKCLKHGFNVKLTKKTQINEKQTKSNNKTNKKKTKYNTIIKCEKSIKSKKKETNNN